MDFNMMGRLAKILQREVAMVVGYIHNRTGGVVEGRWSARGAICDLVVEILSESESWIYIGIQPCTVTKMKTAWSYIGTCN